MNHNTRLNLSLILVALALLVLAVFATVARAGEGGTIPWEGHGSDNLPCEFGHWVFAAGGNHEVTEATLFVDGEPFEMVQSGNGAAFHANAPVPALSENVFVEYVGTLGRGNPLLTLSHCINAPSDTPTLVPPVSVTPEPSDTPPITPTDEVSATKRAPDDVVVLPTTGQGPGSNSPLPLIVGITLSAVALGLAVFGSRRMFG